MRQSRLVRLVRSSLVLATVLAAVAAAQDAGPREGIVPAPVAASPVPPLDAGAPAAQKLNPFPLQRAVDDARVERVLANLDTRGRAAQVLLAYPQLDKAGPVHVGGVLFLGTMLRNTTKAKERIDQSRARAPIPPFFSVDMEGGRSNRLASVKALKDLPSARDMAALSDDEVKDWGLKVGRTMKWLGLNLNLAPVLDVAPSGHMERNQRSYSGDAAVVLGKARAYSSGLLAAGVVPIGKHFPGYGDIDGDSDHHLVTCDWPKARVLAEAKVFADAAPVLGGVMLANVAYAAFDGKPAILSPSLVALVHEHDWLAVTDDIAIQVLADSLEGTTEDVLKQAFLAGNDLILTTAPPDWDRGIDPIGVLERLAQESPKARQRLEESTRRVLRLKDRMGLLDGL
ncbi:MAG: beta-N-acetylhexosaminidase [Myxococcaceae bacterium]|nr:beta-N-acetylhexosaminidase [Myxococcaceae bacterium]